MRQVAGLREPLQWDGDSQICKIMLYEAEGGFYLFGYSSPDAVRCSADRFYGSLEELYGDWNDRIDENGWIRVEDPLPDCQHDALVPLRVKGRNAGKPDWGQYETLKDGQWVPCDGDGRVERAASSEA